MLCSNDFVQLAKIGRAEKIKSKKIFKVNGICIFTAKLRIIRELSKKYLAIVYTEDVAVADFATLLHIVIISAVFSDFQFAGGKQLDVASTSVKIVTQGDAISEIEDRTFGVEH